VLPLLGVEYIARLLQSSLNSGLLFCRNVKYTSILHANLTLYLRSALAHIPHHDYGEYQRIGSIPGFVYIRFAPTPGANCILEPMSPQTSHNTSDSAHGSAMRSTPSSTSANPAHPSITGLIKNAVKAGSHHERVNEEDPDMKDAINAVGEDGGEKTI
jgi:hypothetical protein